MASGAAGTAALLAACQPAAPSTSTALTAGSRAATPTRQNIVFALDFEPSGWDPHVNQATNAHRMIMNVFDPLVYQTADGQFHPGLADSWDISPDGLMYTFKLRQHVTFHDGTPFTAEAVRFSFDRIRDPATRSQLAVSLLGPVESYSVIDPYTIQVRFLTPYPPFLDSLSYAWLSPVSPAAVQKYGAEFGRNLVGTGPFRQKEWVPKQRYVIERNPDYNWAPRFYTHQGPAHLEQITFRFVAELSVRSGAVETGEVDLAGAIETVDLMRLRANPDVNVIVTPVPGAPRSLFLNTTRAPLNDVEVRRALLHATNKMAVVETLQSSAYQLAFGPLSRATFGYDRSIENGGYVYDLARAKKLLNDVGWTVGADGTRRKGGQPLRLTYISLNANRDPQQGELLQALWKEAGIDLEIQVFPGFAQQSAAIAANGYHVVPGWWVQSDPTVLTQIYHSRNVKANNWSKSSIPELDRLLEQGDAEPDTTRRAAAFARVQKLVMDHSLSVPVWDHGDIVAARSALDGLTFDRRGQYFWLYDAFVKA